MSSAGGRRADADPGASHIVDAQFGVVQSQFSAYSSTTLFKKDPLRTKVSPTSG